MSKPKYEVFRFSVYTLLHFDTDQWQQCSVFAVSADDATETTCLIKYIYYRSPRAKNSGHSFADTETTDANEPVATANSGNGLTEVGKVESECVGLFRVFRNGWRLELLGANVYLSNNYYGLALNLLRLSSVTF